MYSRWGVSRLDCIPGVCVSVCGGGCLPAASKAALSIALGPSSFASRPVRLQTQKKETEKKKSVKIEQLEAWLAQRQGGGRGYNMLFADSYILCTWPAQGYGVA